MDSKPFEYLLNKNISVAKDFIGSDLKRNEFKKDKFEIKFYSYREYVKKDFYGMSYNHVTILTNKDDIVQSVTIHFSKPINREFYDAFNKQYGEPNNIQIVENRKTVSETIIKDKNDNITERLKKSSFDLREGTFEDNPLYNMEKSRFSSKSIV